jgi:hypothetical protein
MIETWIFLDDIMKKRNAKHKADKPELRFAFLGVADYALR